LLLSEVHGLTMEDVADTVAAALGGRPAGLLFSGDRRYQIDVRVSDVERKLGASACLKRTPAAMTYAVSAARLGAATRLSAQRSSTK
jgi:Cu/Ag efflux pump CusA